MALEFDEVFPFIMTEYLSLRTHLSDLPKTIADVQEEVINNPDLKDVQVSKLFHKDFHSKRNSKIRTIEDEIKKRQTSISQKKDRLIRHIFFFCFQTYKNREGVYDDFHWEYWMENPENGQDTLINGNSNPTALDVWKAKSKFFVFENLVNNRNTISGVGWADLIPYRFEKTLMENDRFLMHDDATNTYKEMTYKDALEIAETSQVEFIYLEEMHNQIEKYEIQKNILNSMETEQKILMYILEQSTKWNGLGDLSNSLLKKFGKYGVGSGEL